MKSSGCKKQDKKFNHVDFMPGMKSWVSIQKKKNHKFYNIYKIKNKSQRCKKTQYSIAI